MNRVLSILAAALCMAANVGAAPVPNHQQPQVKNSAIPMATKSAQRPTQKSSKAEPKPYQVGTRILVWQAVSRQDHGQRRGLRHVRIYRRAPEAPLGELSSR